MITGRGTLADEPSGRNLPDRIQQDNTQIY